MNNFIIFTYFRHCSRFDHRKKQYLLIKQRFRGIHEVSYIVVTTRIFPIRQEFIRSPYDWYKFSTPCQQACHGFKASILIVNYISTPKSTSKLQSDGSVVKSIFRQQTCNLQNLSVNSAYNIPSFYCSRQDHAETFSTHGDLEVDFYILELLATFFSFVLQIACLFGTLVHI